MTATFQPPEICSTYNTSIGIDVIPPYLTVDALPDTILEGDLITITGTVNDSQTDVASVHLFDGPVYQTAATINTTTNPHTWTLEWQPETPRTYQLTIIATDNAGNQTRSQQENQILETAAITQITAGGSHTCGLTNSGTAYCWGNGGEGRLGNGTTTSAFVPTPVANVTNFTQITAGGLHTCGLASNGTAYCWGFGGYGQLGNGTTTDALVPTPVANVTNFTQITAGSLHTCGLASNGTAYCWGFGGNGRLGNGTIATALAPTQVSPKPLQ